MAPKTRVDAVFVHTFLCSLMAIICPSIVCTETDIACLKSIKNTLEDPYDFLNSSWDFSNKTEGFICRFFGVDCWHPDENKVLNLRLSGMGLKGQFPRGIENCTSLVGLDLSYNELTGPIPFDVGRILGFLTSLDLSSNNFSGEIPESIADLSYLNSLRLDNNLLTGTIPPQIGHLTRIKRFSVANNMLEGPVPHFSNATFTVDSYANNGGLCGKPLERCEKEYFTFKAGFKMGYAMAIVVSASYCVVLMNRGKGNPMITKASMVKRMLRKKNKKAEFDHLVSLSTMDFLLDREISTSEHFVTRMSFKDLCHATNNFNQDNIIGFGQTGTTYMATLSSGWHLAVKKFFNSDQSKENFITELKILRKLRHDNLVPLIGFCKESNRRLLVYKYISNGNLFDWLHSMEDKKTLEWPLRMKIASGLARGLAWLHHSSHFRVAHLSITSKCVLLDQNFEPKLSNFGMASQIDPREINSSRGFCMDMEFWEQCYLKEDVYGFGVVLLELITGKRVEFLDCYNGDLSKLTSDIPSSSSSSSDGVDEWLKIACNCVQPIAEQRPSMLDVYTAISIIRDRRDHALQTIERKMN